MSSIYETIQNTRKEFRKDVEKTVEFSVLTLVIGEIETITKRDGSEPTDEKMISVIKKIIKGNNEIIQLHNGSGVEKFNRENMILQSFLPVERTREELYEIISSLKMTTIGAVMKALGEGDYGKFDRGLASQVAKEVLQESGK